MTKKECLLNKNGICEATNSECNYTKLCDLFLDSFIEEYLRKSGKKSIDQQAKEILESWFK